MNRKHYVMAIAVLLLAAGGTLSCVDKDYRVGFDDIDGNVQIAQGGLDIPLAVIEEYKLGDLLKDKDEFVVGDHGYYALHNEGGASENILGALIIASEHADHYFLESDLPSIDLSDLTEGIGQEGEELVLDIASPRIIMSITNPANVTISGDLFLQHAGMSESVDVVDITVAPMQTSWLFIAEDGIAPPDDREYELVEPRGLGEIFHTAPGSIDVKFAAGVHGGGAGQDVDPLAQYEFGITYKVVLPLVFGPKTRIPVGVDTKNEKDTKNNNGLHSIFKELADKGVKVKDIKIKAELETSFPFKMSNVALKFLDESGNPITGITTTVTGDLEGPHPSAHDAVRSDLTIDLSVAGDGDLAAFSAIDNLDLRLLLTPTAGEGEVSGFIPDDFIRGRVWATIPEGIIVDLREIKK